MKKLYLLLAAALITSVAIAKVDYNQKQPRNKSEVSFLNVDYNSTQEVNAEEDLTLAPPLERFIHPTAIPGEGEAFYYRPHGSFYAGFNTETGTVYYKPYLFLPCYRTSTYLGRIEGLWEYQVYNSTNKQREWLTAEGKDLPVRYATVYDTVPTLNGDGSQYFLFGINNDQTDIAPCILYPRYDIQILSSMEHRYASPKYFGAYSRAGVDSTGTKLITGALDQEGGNSAYWFGRNWSGYNGCAIYCEKPENTYVIRGAAIRYYKYMATDNVDLKMSIYKVLHHASDSISVGDLIAQATATLPATNEETSGELYFTFTEVDEEYGLISEITPEIDDEIYVVLSGYDNDALTKLGLYISGDMWDEGIGEVGYNLMLDEDGKIMRARGLTRMFASAYLKGYSAPGIFLDVIYPFIINNYTNDPSVRKYDAAGNLIYDGTEDLFYGNNFSAYTTEPSEMWDITLADGSDIPDWLTLTPEDEYEDGELTGEVNVGIEVAPLPADLAGRKAVVRFSIIGHHHDLTIIQGEEPADTVAGDVDGDGVCTAGDITALYNYLLNNDSSAIVNGDQDGDGTITAGDITFVYNILLGN